MVIKRRTQRKLLVALGVIVVLFVLAVAGAGAAKKANFLQFLLGRFANW